MSDQHHYDSSGNYIGKTSPDGPSSRNLTDEEWTRVIAVVFFFGVLLFCNYINHDTSGRFGFISAPNNYSGPLSWLGWYYHIGLIWPTKIIFGIGGLDLTNYANLNLVIKFFLYSLIIFLPILLWKLKPNLMDKLAWVVIFAYIAPLILIVLVIAFFWLFSENSVNKANHTSKYIPEKPLQISQVSTNAENSRFVVVGISTGDFLNIREEPNANSKIVGKIPSGIIVTSSGKKERRGSDTWIYIYSSAGHGWVNIKFLKNT